MVFLTPGVLKRTVLGGQRELLTKCAFGADTTIEIPVTSTGDTLTAKVGFVNALECLWEAEPTNLIVTSSNISVVVDAETARTLLRSGVLVLLSCLFSEEPLRVLYVCE